MSVEVDKALRRMSDRLDEFSARMGVFNADFAEEQYKMNKRYKERLDVLGKETRYALRMLARIMNKLDISPEPDDAD